MKSPRQSYIWKAFFFGLLSAVPGHTQGLITTWQDALSKPTFSNIRFQMYEVPMPDGVKLSVAVWRPVAEGQKFPVILEGTPYDKMNGRFDAKYFAARGYVYVAYDLRGRYDSEGQAYLYGKQDGADLNTIQTWIADQPWSSGKIGMHGSSYRGFIQWEGALYRNPHLSALIPMVSPDDHSAQFLENCTLLWYSVWGGRSSWRNRN